MEDYAVVLTTCADRAKARSIARALVERRLAACVQMLPIDSVYTWQDRLEEAAEILLLIKIKRADYVEIESAILALHEYETPEIVALPIEQGSAAYLDWIEAVTQRKAER
ncbi:MAG TPA: divalent-cation tolerance protein CutA [Methylovirgula sp.]|nr:divalent-cation tolerance protein CutA [Methylovirgula sp.]